ncbi:uncharacterized protein LOC131658546 [Vicia villosa]|uniref:uncharacterized protein LOC131658546 n=1 Tax=Vicia villosa TaxID=3911 RepID=UPI00273C7AF3|nr:uncharacterized protein LOC131658546 [Vicia villosa]
MYNEIRGSDVDRSWKTIFYQNYARPQACFTMWLALWGRLPTKDRLAKIKILTDGLCNFCGNPKSIQHLFFTCSYTAQIWQRILTWLGYKRNSGDGTKESNWLSMESKKKGWRRILLRMAATESVYHLWQARNALCFEQTVPSQDMLQHIQNAVILRAQTKKCLKNHVQLANLEIR